MHEPCFLTWNAKVACRTIDGTAFILNDGQMVSLNGVGSFIWAKFEEGSTIEDAIDAVLDFYDVDVKTARADSIEFIRTLRDRNMLVAASGDDHDERRGCHADQTCLEQET